MVRSFPGRVLMRYGFVVAVIGLAVSAGMVCAGSRAATSSGDAQTEFVYVGTQQAQIRALRLDTATGTLTEIGTVAEGPKTTWVAAHPQLPVLYGVDDDNARDGSITAYAVNRETGMLDKINEVASGGRGTTNLVLDPPSNTLLAANYASGSVSSVAINPDGSLGARVSTVTETGSGPNRRQASAHAHSALVDPSGRYALVPDLGADRVFIYRFDRATHALLADGANDPEAFVVPPGSGPRHIVFGSNGEFVYLLTELSAEVMVLRWDAEQGKLALVQSLPVTNPGFDGVKSGAEIALSQDGRFVYVEDRGENALVVYRVNSRTGELAPIQRTPSGGDRPWGFAIDSSGKWLLVANQHSGNVSVFSVDPVSGKVANTGESVALPTPVSVAFVK
jgi:6-phosphogluconolactonase